MRFLVIFLILQFILTPLISLAESEADLKNQIESKNNELKQIEEQIKVTQENLQNTNQKSKTIESEVNRLNKNINQLKLGIRSAELSLSKLSLEIGSLNNEVSDIETEINVKNESVAKVLKEIQVSEEESPIITFLRGNTLADSFESVQVLIDINNRLILESNILKELRDKYSNFIICSNAVIQPENIDFLTQIKDYWKRHNIAGAFSVIQAPFYTHSTQSAYNCISRFSREDIQQIKAIGPKSKGMNYYLDNNFRRPLHCFAGYASMFIDPFGKVYPCNFLGGNDDYLMGTIKDSEIDTVWVSRSASDSRFKVKGCPYTTCWNGCEVDQTMIQFEPVERLTKAVSFGFLSYYKIKGLNGFK